MRLAGMVLRAPPSGEYALTLALTLALLAVGGCSIPVGELRVLAWHARSPPPLPLPFHLYRLDVYVEGVRGSVGWRRSWCVSMAMFASRGGQDNSHVSLSGRVSVSTLLPLPPAPLPCWLPVIGNIEDACSVEGGGSCTAPSSPSPSQVGPAAPVGENSPRSCAGTGGRGGGGGICLCVFRQRGGHISSVLSSTVYLSVCTNVGKEDMRPAHL